MGVSFWKPSSATTPMSAGESARVPNSPCSGAGCSRTMRPR
jgi:hypothetical protein